MVKNRHIITIFLAVILLSATIAAAHVPYIEPEVVRRWGHPVEGDDFSFEHPFIIPSGTISNSKAIFAYLSYGDVDVYQYTLQEGETLPWIICAALAPACRIYRNTYPSIALLGPGLPDPGENLPLTFRRAMVLWLPIRPRYPPGKNVLFSLFLLTFRV